MIKYTPRPFLKWAGGKTKMIQHILPFVPEKVEKYYEPFLGGGALFFDLFRRKRFRRAVLGDENEDLIRTYKCLQKDCDALIECLRGEKYVYDRDAYLAIRAEDTSGFSDVEKAARFIYLNKTCFNGLYRVNKLGKFNVPFGKYDDPIICDEANLRGVSTALKKARVERCDFAASVKDAKVGDFVYLDPPYFPLSDTSKFVSYTEKGFGLAEHSQLSVVFADLARRGVSVVLSNSLCETTRQLYRDFEIIEVSASRNVGGPADYRKNVKEMMVVANCRTTTQQKETEHCNISA